MKGLLIVTRSANLLTLSLRTTMEKMGYEVDVTGYDLKNMPKLTENIAAIILNVDEDTADDMQELIYLKDQALEMEIKFFILGASEDIEKMGDCIPQHIIAKTVYRPVNVANLAETIHEFAIHKEENVKKTILVVDDSGAMLLAVKSWLEHSYKVIMANSGTMAIKYLTVNHPDLVLLDYEMPILDGKQVLEMIRSEEDFKNTPVIFLTGKGDKESVMKVMSLKPEGYLLKTMPPAQIKAEIDEFFEKNKAEL